MKANADDLTAIDDIGPRIADSIVAYFSDAKNPGPSSKNCALTASI